MGNINIVNVVCERSPNENKCPAVLQRHTFWISIVLMKPVRSWIVLCYSRSDLLLKDFMSFFKLFIPSKCNFFDTVYSVVCTVHHGIKHFVFKSKMANSITVLQVEPYSCPSSILFQFSWGKVWSKTIHNSQSFHAAVKTLSYGMWYLHFGKMGSVNSRQNETAYRNGICTNCGALSFLYSIEVLATFNKCLETLWIVFDQTFKKYQSLIIAHCVQTKQLIWWIMVS